MFWESINAAGVLGVPMVVSIWDDGYGISVPNELPDHQGRPLGACSPASGASRGTTRGYDLYTVRGWDYPALCETYLAAAADRAHASTCRRSSTSSR